MVSADLAMMGGSVLEAGLAWPAPRTAEFSPGTPFTEKPLRAAADVGRGVGLADVSCVRGQDCQNKLPSFLRMNKSASELRANAP
eukprot:1161681-Pelagomonas_calceolata.AAC.9